MTRRSHAARKWADRAPTMRHMANLGRSRRTIAGAGEIYGLAGQEELPTNCIADGPSHHIVCLLTVLPGL